MSEEGKKEYLGDKVSKVLDKVGVAKVHRSYRRLTNQKKPCGCQKRKEALNNWHKRQIEKAQRQRLKQRERARKNQTDSEST